MDEKMINQELESGVAVQEGASVGTQEAIAEETLKEAGEVTAQEEINEVDGEPIYHADEGEE